MCIRDSRTVVVMPIYNESSARIFAAVAAIRESVEATGLGDHFDYFIVSDTTNPDVWVAEERAFLAPVSYTHLQLGATKGFIQLPSSIFWIAGG